MKFSSFLLLGATTFGNPILKRQDVTAGSIGITEDEVALLTAGGPKLAELIGSGDVATEKLTAFAKLLGANATEPGTVGSVMSGQTNGKYGRVPDPQGATPRIQELSPREKTPGSKSVKIRYGPYLVPNAGHKNIIEEEGMLSNYPDDVVPKPCSECTIIGMTAGLEYPDGKNANIDSGMWLHHFVIFAAGPGRVDATCGHRDVSLPHVTAGLTARNSERFWSAGNERTPFSFPVAGHNQTGYMINKEDKFHLLMDLMNLNMEDAVLYFTITYDYVEGHPAGWKTARPVWLDVANCGTSEMNPPTQNGSFVLKSTWVPNFKGRLIQVGAHLHDGGDTVQIDINGKQTCESVATYGGNPEYVQKPSAGGGHSHSGATEHISKMGICYGKAFGPTSIEPGQQVEIRALYDYKKNKGMAHSDGKQDHVMGIAIIWVEI